MSTKIKIMLIAVAAGLLFWLIDAVLDYSFFYSNTFIELLLTNVPAHELYVRIAVLILFLSFGSVIGVFLKERKKNQGWLENIQSILTPKVELSSPVPQKDSLTVYTTSGAIYNAVGPEILYDITKDYIGIMATAGAIFEQNGDMALKMTISPWCQ